MAPRGRSSNFGVRVPEIVHLGMNIEAMTYFSSIWPFTDVMKHSDGWRDLTSSAGAIALRDDGYPESLASGQVAWTFIYWDLDGHYPGGTYNVSYEGLGTLVFGGDATNAQTLQQGVGPSGAWTRMSFDVTTPAGGIFVQMHDTDPSDPIHNMRIQAPGEDFDTYKFHSAFLKQIDIGYHTLRFSTWSQASTSDVVSWADRTLTTDQTQDTDYGVAWEHMIDLTNETQARPYICIPWKADDNYVRQLARLWRRECHVGPIYIERGNEAWNTVFGDQYAYNVTQGNAAGITGSDYNKAIVYNGVRSAEVFQIFAAEFPQDAVVRCLSCQLANTGTTTAPMDYGDTADYIDALAINAYIGEDLGEHPTAATTVGWTSAQVLAEMENIIRGTFTTRLRTYKALAKTYNTFTMAYEGGQHLAPDQVDPNGSGETPWKNDATLLALFKEANEADGMEDVYDLLFDTWDAELGGPLILYQSHGDNSSSGDWGSRRYMDSPDSQSPKMRAILKRLARRL